MREKTRNIVHRSIYSKLFLIFFVIGVIPLIAGSFYSYTNSRNALLHSALNEQNLEVSNGMRNIVTLFVESGVNLLLTSQNAAFVRYFEEPDELDIYRQAQTEALVQITSMFPGVIRSAGFVDTNGTIINSVIRGESSQAGGAASNMLDRPFFRETLALQKGEVYHGPPEYFDDYKKWIIHGATPVFNRQGITIGILYLEIYIESIKRFLKGIAHPDDSVFVLDQAGHIIVHSRRIIGETLPPAGNSDAHPSYQAAIQHMMGGEDGNMRVFYEGSPAYLTYKYIPEDKQNRNKWSIGVLTFEKTIYADVSANNYLIFVLSASVGLFIIAGVLGWRIAHPLQELTSTSVAMSRGDLGSRVSISRSDEIGQLAHAFNDMATSIQASHKELTKLSITDGLTGLYNHREFQKQLEEEVRRAARYGSVISLLMIDIDGFKKFNDTYGHPAGDVVLSSLSKKMLKEIRASDVAARYGGEEMVIILPETSSEEALIFSERLRKDIAQLPITVLGGGVVHITVSIGIASFPDDASDRAGLIDAADQALYFAKEKGRNRTILYGDTMKATLEHKPTKAQALLEQAEEWIFKDLCTSVEAKLPYHRGHLEAIKATSLQIAEALHLSDEETRDLKIASMLYEVGMINIPSHILLKHDSLTREEWDVVRTHPEISVKLLSSVLKVQNIFPAILHHHERYDGTGYPSGMKGEDIPILARIISIVDAYYSMTSVTPYRRKFTREEAVEELRQNAGTQFDPQIVEIFVETLMSKKG